MQIRIGEPIKRPRLARWLLTAILCFLYVWRKLRLPKGMWPRQVRGILHNWTDSMFGILIKTRLKQAYPDQPCSLRQPATYKPKVDVAPEHKLADDDVKFFFENGYLPPFDAFSEQEVREFQAEIDVARKEVCSHYGIVTDRDHHLSLPTMMEFIRRPAVVERCAQLLGPDLVCWRSQFFYKPPHGKAVQWHQASTYLVEDYLEPALRPPDRDDLFQLTVWVAVDPATKANGCLRVIPGTADRIRTITFGGGDASFYKASYSMNQDFSETPAAYLEAKPGQVIIFAERTVHGSSDNSTDNSRSAFNFRVVRPDTQVYKDKRFHRAKHMGQRYELEHWGCVLVRGQDKEKLNKMVTGATRAQAGSTAS